jgi:hypothetical protein
MSPGQGRHFEHGRGRVRARLQPLCQELRNDLDLADEQGGGLAPPTGVGTVVQPADVAEDEGMDDPGEEGDVTTEAGEAEHVPAGPRLEDVIGSRAPRVMFRLVRVGEGVRAEFTAGLRPELRPSLERVRKFLQDRFDRAPGSLGADWPRLLDPSTPLPTRLLLMTRLAVRGQARLDETGTDRSRHNDVGLERYAGKFAALPDGLPFSLRLLLEDGQGKRKAAGPSFNQIPYALQLRALRQALARERQEGAYRTDAEFAGLLAEVLGSMGIALDARTGEVGREHIVGLRQKLEYHGVGGLFPNRSERRKAGRGEL